MKKETLHPAVGGRQRTRCGTKVVLLTKLHHMLLTMRSRPGTVAVVQLLSRECLTFCDLMDCSTPGFLVLHYLPEFAQTHIHWVSDAIQSSHPLVISFSSCLQSFPASASFPMSQFLASGGQNIGASALASVLPMNIQDWFPLGWTGWISLLSRGLSRVFSNTTVQKHQFFGAQLSL